MKDGYHVNCTVSSNFLLDKSRVAENLQKECLCYFIMYFSNLINLNQKEDPFKLKVIVSTLRFELVQYVCVKCE